MELRGIAVDMTRFLGDISFQILSQFGDVFRPVFGSTYALLQSDLHTDNVCKHTHIKTITGSNAAHERDVRFKKCPERSSGIDQ